MSKWMKFSQVKVYVKLDYCNKCSLPKIINYLKQGAALSILTPIVSKSAPKLVGVAQKNNLGEWV